MWSALAAAAVPAVASFLGQSEANAANIKQAREQMAFQERMSSTAVRRAMEDMRLAGINPIMAAGAAASTPSGAAARVEDAIGPAVSSAQHGRRLSRELDLLRTQELQARSAATASQTQSALNVAHQEEAFARTRNMDVQTALLNADLPGALNRARVESSRAGLGAAWVDRVMRTIMPVATLGSGIGLASRLIPRRNFAGVPVQFGNAELLRSFPRGR